MLTVKMQDPSGEEHLVPVAQVIDKLLAGWRVCDVPKKGGCGCR